MVVWFLLTMAHEIKYYEFDEVKSADIIKGVHGAVDAATEVLANSKSADEKFVASLSDSKVQEKLIMISRLPVFSKEMGRAFQDDLDLLRILKQLKYFWNLPKTHLAILLEQVAEQVCGSEKAAPFRPFQND